MGLLVFTLNLSNATFIVDANGNKSIDGLIVRANIDNFDYAGGGVANLLANNPILIPAFDPYRIGREAVPIEFIDPNGQPGIGKTYNNYNLDKYSDHTNSEASVSIVGTASRIPKDISWNCISTSKWWDFLF